MPISNPGLGGVITYGSYVGDNTVNRAIPHSLLAIPKAVFLVTDSNTYYYRIIRGLAHIRYLRPADYGGGHNVTAMDATNFYVGNAASQIQSANDIETFYWVAMR